MSEKSIEVEFDEPVTIGGEERKSITVHMPNNRMIMANGLGYAMIVENELDDNPNPMGPSTNKIEIRPDWARLIGNILPSVTQLPPDDIIDADFPVVWKLFQAYQSLTMGVAKSSQNADAAGNSSKQSQTSSSTTPDPSPTKTS